MNVRSYNRGETKQKANVNINISGVVQKLGLFTKEKIHSMKVSKYVEVLFGLKVKNVIFNILRKKSFNSDTIIKRCSINDGNST